MSFVTDDIIFSAFAGFDIDGDVDFTTDDVTFSATGGGEGAVANVSFVADDVSIASFAGFDVDGDVDFITDDVAFEATGINADIGSVTVEFITDDVQFNSLAMQVYFTDSSGTQLVSEVTVCNQALGRLGEYYIMSISEATKLARYCKRFYYTTRDEVLREHPWNFASHRATLTELDNPPEFEWAHAFQLPEDFVRLRRLNSWTEFEEFSKWEIEADTLLTDDEVAQIKYTRKITNVALWDPLAVEALSLKLAAKLALPITGSSEIVKDLLLEYKTIVLPQAERIDAAENKDKRKPAWATSTLVQSRMAGS